VFPFSQRASLPGEGWHAECSWRDLANSTPKILNLSMLLGSPGKSRVRGARYSSVDSKKNESKECLGPVVRGISTFELLVHAGTKDEKVSY